MRVAYGNILLVTIFIYIHGGSIAQFSRAPKENNQVAKNKVIGPETLTGWCRVGMERDLALSPDGKYATWSIDNWRDKKYTFVVGASKGGWRQEFHNKKPIFEIGFFTENSNQYIFPIRKGLCIVPLGSGEPQYIRPVNKWRQNGTGRWLAWQENDTGAVMLRNLRTGKISKLQAMHSFLFDKTGQWLISRSVSKGSDLYLYNLVSGKKLIYDNVESYKLNDDSRILLLVRRQDKRRNLSMVRLWTGMETVIYDTDERGDIVNFEINQTETAVTFTTKDIIDEVERFSHWYYRIGTLRPIKLVDEQSADLPSTFKLSAWSRFVEGDKFIFFMLMKEPDRRVPLVNAVMVDVWSYTDKTFYTEQRKDKQPSYFPAVISVEGGKVVQLISQDFEKLEGEVKGEYALVSKRQTGDRFWEYRRDSIWLVHLKTGTRKLLPFIKTPWVELKDEGTAVVAFDVFRGRHYYRYDINTGLERRLSLGVPDWTLGIENPFMTGWEETRKWVNHEIAAYTEDKNAIFTYDNFDIWKIDLGGKTSAVNITNNFGRKNKIVFRVCLNTDKIVRDKDELLLTAFNEKNKDNGFYRTRLVHQENPVNLFMGPYFFAHDRKIIGNLMPNPYGVGMVPVKATKADAWLVRRESATEAPNYYFTCDFKKFIPLTNLRPQSGYNWYTTELVNFRQTDGTENQGVLYKPVDFDPQKKYPVLFYYYEQYSYGLNCFMLPEVSDAGKPVIPWYVSRGYLVFTPDNFFEKGWRYRSCLQAILGAANRLKKFPFIDSLRMGLMGLSQGGGFTNYIITNSSLFAAAFEGCGVSDRISAALQWGGINGEVGSRLPVMEQLNGSNMWDRPEQWVPESPILLANKVTTPLLIMHNRKDGAVLFEQAVAMFTALRRLSKKVWLLQYDEGDHGVGGKEGLDLTIRMTQFFDHYLKGMAQPRWMTEGISSSLKGIDNGLELIEETSNP